MKKRTWFLAAILSLSALPLMTGCGTASESDIEEDLLKIIKEDYWFKGFNPEIDDIEIEKRKTDEDDKTDVIYIVADVKDDVKEINAGYKLTYMEYNDGWELEYHEPYGYSEGLWETDLKDVLSEEKIIEDFKYRKDVSGDVKGYSLENITDKKEAIKNKSFTAELIKPYENEYHTMISKEILTYEWCPGAYAEAWTCTDTDSETEYVYDVKKIAGTWQSDDGNIEFVLSEDDGKLKAESIKGTIADGLTLNGFVNADEFNTNINELISNNECLDETLEIACPSSATGGDYDPYIYIGVYNSGFEVFLNSGYSDFEKIELKKVN
ncbi:MAG: hypothetical protein IJA12_07685 [Oscillospiraceae bacterium]|nr:hypothetical protein [Oscillospiraceae bacterium]